MHFGIQQDILQKKKLVSLLFIILLQVEIKVGIRLTKVYHPLPRNRKLSFMSS